MGLLADFYADLAPVVSGVADDYAKIVTAKAELESARNSQPIVTNQDDYTALINAQNDVTEDVNAQALTPDELLSVLRDKNRYTGLSNQVMLLGALGLGVVLFLRK